MPHTQHRFYFWAMSISHTTLYVSVWIHWRYVCVCDKLRFRSFFFFFLFSRVLEECGYCSMNSSHKCWLFPVNSAFVHCSWTHKFHFSTTFSLKIGPTALFTYLKNILLQCFQFSVFSFSKISSIHTFNSSYRFCYDISSCNMQEGS